MRSDGKNDRKIVINLVIRSRASYSIAVLHYPYMSFVWRDNFQVSMYLM